MERRKSQVLFIFSPPLISDLTKKDILSVSLILNHIPLFGVWSTVNRESTGVEHPDPVDVHLD
jgi:hypothetical protein